MFANIFQTSFAYLTIIFENEINCEFVNTNQFVITFFIKNLINFYVVRHANYNNFAFIKYRIKLRIIQKFVNVSQLSFNFIFNERDSKIHVTNYNFEKFINIFYFTINIFT